MSPFPASRIGADHACPRFRLIILLGVLLLGLLTTCQPTQQLSPDAGRTEIRFSNYRVLFDRNQEGHPASGGTLLYVDGKLSLAFQRASDGDSGVQTTLARSQDGGKTWSVPAAFGPSVEHSDTAFQACGFVGISARGTTIASGSHNSSGIQTSGEGINWRPNTALIGRKTTGQSEFHWARYDSGTFLGEQFVAGGLFTRSGRIVLTIWGSRRKGENWQCGVLLSDDDGKSWRYRQVGYAADLALRDKPEEPIGYNEQTLFEAHDGTLVSLIRGRQKLAQLVDRQPRETYFSRAVSTDGGETWSQPELTNLSGTGATGAGLTLPDGSLITAARIPHHVETTWIQPPNPRRYGLHLARSFDLGKTWESDRFFQQDPGGLEFDNYYNAMNGQFVQLEARNWMYAFGHFDVKRDLHRILAFDLSWD